jgi:hypothetical protein
MATQLFANNATGALASGTSNSATSLTLSTGQGALFPTPSGGDWFLLTLTQATGPESSWEIVKCTARSGDTLTVVRAQEGTTALVWAIAKAELRITAGTLVPAVAGGANGLLLGADKTKLDCTSGTNTGDETLASIKSKLAISTLSGSNTGDQTNISGNAATATTATNLSGGSVAATTITATGNITAYYSDERLKTRLGNIENALDKVDTLDTFYYEANELAQSLGYEPVREVGLSAQQVLAVMPEVVAVAPIDPEYLTVRYERLLTLAIAAIKELRAEVKELRGER